METGRLASVQRLSQPLTFDSRRPPTPPPLNLRHLHRPPRSESTGATQGKSHPTPDVAVPLAQLGPCCP